MPEKVKEAVPAAVNFYQKALEYLDKIAAENNGNFVCTLPVFQGGERCNVISESVFISGTIRSLIPGLAETALSEL